MQTLVASTLVQATKAIITFTAELLGATGKLIKAERLDDGGWAGYVEVYEESTFMRSLGRASAVRDRNVYEVVLDRDLEVISYSKLQDAKL
ncbi:MAG: hypothetical protein IAF08_13130 [Rhizobacter sp.]|nr:hypothetical protein [Chlorobiales bacterium]